MQRFIVKKASDALEMFGLRCFSYGERPSGFRQLLSTVKSKNKLPAARHAVAMGERKYSSYSFLTSALDGGERVVSVMPRPRFTSEKRPRYQLDRRLGGTLRWSGHRG
jgi:hypothetical protein